MQLSDDAPGAGMAAPARLSGQALKVTETKASEYIARLQAQQADPEELAVIVSMFYGAALRGFCRGIVKALGISHA